MRSDGSISSGLATHAVWRSFDVDDGATVSVLIGLFSSKARAEAAVRALASTEGTDLYEIEFGWRQWLEGYVSG